MASYLMLGKYSAGALEGISAERTGRAAGLIKAAGGEVKCMYALLGAYDLVFIVDLPDTAAAMKASVALSCETGIAFQTMPALSVEEFDRVMGA